MVAVSHVKLMTTATGGLSDSGGSDGGPLVGVVTRNDGVWDGNVRGVS